MSFAPRLYIPPNMITRSTIANPYSMREAYGLILSLEAEYLRAHKRKSAIELTLSSTSKPIYDDRGRPKLSNEVVEVRAVYESDDQAQLTEAQWFEEAAARATLAARVGGTV